MARERYKIVVDPEDASLFRIKDTKTGALIAPAVSNYGKAQELLEAVRNNECQNYDPSPELSAAYRECIKDARGIRNTRLRFDPRLR